MLQHIHIGDDALTSLATFLQSRAFDKIVVLVDENTFTHCYPLLKKILPEHAVIKINSGEKNKTLETCSLVWEEMTRLQLTRWSLLLNLGGGVIGDLGGFCAAVFKRGIYFAQIPTTLLAQVDASVGGKTGVDFKGLKNHLGIFQEPLEVFIYPGFLQTLPLPEIKSGYAEVIKHWLIAKKTSFEEQKYIGLMTEDWTAIIRESVEIKYAVVQADPLEQGYRKVLNFGHTVGHAIETYCLNQTSQPLLHGEAVAMGMVCEAYLSKTKGFLTEAELTEIETFLFSVFEKKTIPVAAIPEITNLVLQDKKNTGAIIKCTLLEGIGKAIYDQPVSLAEIQESIQYYCSL